MTFRLGSFNEPSNHADQIPSGFFVPGFVRTVLGVVAAVDEIVDAVRWARQHTVNGAEAIAPGHVAVVFAHKGAVEQMLGLNNAERKISPLMSPQWYPHTRIASIEHMSGT